MLTIVTNPAYASILHRFVATMAPEHNAQVEPPLHCLTALQEFSRSGLAPPELLERANQLYHLYFDEVRVSYQRGSSL